MSLKISPKHIVLDLYQSRHVIIQASQYDVDSRELIIHVTSDGEFYAVPQNYTASIEYKKADDTIGVVDCDILEDGTLSFIITEQMTAVAGHCKCDLMLISNKQAVNTASFIINVRESAVHGDEIKSKDEFTSLNKTIVKARSAIATMTQMQEDFDEYIDESTEKIDYCIEQAEKAQVIAEKNVEDAIASAEAAQASEDAAKASEDAAKVSETNAKSSETKSKTSETNSKTSETNAKASENAAKTSEANAKTSETNAKTSENNANTYANAAQTSKESAQASANTATTKANEAKTSATNANESANLAAEKAEEMVDYADQSKSYAIGTNGEYRAGDSTDNAKYYYEQTKNISLDITKSNGYECINSKPGGYRLNDLVGKTEQKQLNGKNKLNYDVWKNTQAERATAVYENNGVTLTANGNDAYTYSGNTRVDVNEGDKVIISWEESTNASGNIYIFPNGSTTDSMYRNNSVTKRVTYTVPSGVTYIGFRFGVANAGTTISYKNIMITVNDDDPTFEPWCGGTSSPNSSFPQAIENTFDCVEMIQGYYTKTTGVYTNSSKYVCTKNKIPCKSGDVLYIKSVKSFGVFVVYYANGTFLSYANVTGEITVPSEANEFVFSVYNEDGLTTQTVGKITLTVNGKYLVPIKGHGKNIFGGLAFANAITSMVNTSSLDTTKKCVNVPTKTVANVYKNFKENTRYTIMLRGSNTNQTYATHSNLAVYYSDGTYTTLVLNSDETMKKVVTPVDKSVTGFGSIASAGVGKIYYEDFGIFEGVLELEDFEEYKETLAYAYLDEPLRATDRVVKVDGVHMENHKRTKKVFDGSEDESISLWGLNGTNCERFVIHLSSNYAKLNTALRCSHLEFKAYNSSDTPHCSLSSSDSYVGNQIIIFVPKTVATTAAELRTWLASNPMEFEYELAEETYTPLDTASQLALNDMETFDGVTYIEVDSKIPPTSISGEYGTSQVGAYTLKCMNDNDTDRVERAEMKARLDELAVALVSQ